MSAPSWSASSGGTRRACADGQGALYTATASQILRKLAAYPRQNGLAIALREMGRIERTLYVLNWFQSPELRRRVTEGLNKGEAQNALARAILFNRRGTVQDRSFKDQRNRASGLNLVVAAIILWNTVGLEQTIEAMRTEGEDVPEEHLEHVAPLGWAKIILTGEYVWDWQQATRLHGKRIPRPADE